MSDALATGGAGGGADRRFLGHPLGLAVLAFTEAWERFSFYGMQALLVLYMIGQLLTPGHLEHVLGLDAVRASLETVTGPLGTQALASLVFGFYSGLAYLLPVFGGLIGDRWAGQHAMVTIGAALMAAGHVLMAFEAPFLIALALLITGSGCLKGNISTQVGSLYAPGDRRRTDAFQVFQFGINVGVVLAPFVCGTLGERYGWHYGFAAAAIGMLIGLVIYLAGKRHLPPDLRAVRASAVRQPLTAADWKVIGALLFVLLVVVLFLTSGNQLGNVYPLWVKGHVDRGAGGFTIPVTWFLSGTAIASLVLPPLILRWWAWQHARGVEGDEMTKLRAGTLVATGAFAVLALLAWRAGDGVVDWVWLIPYHALFALAYLLIWPVGMSLFARAAPPRVATFFIGIFYTSVFFANIAVGAIGGWDGRMQPATFWAIQAAIGGAAFVLMLVFGPSVGGVIARDARTAKRVTLA